MKRHVKKGPKKRLPKKCTAKKKVPPIQPQTMGGDGGGGEPPE